MSWQRWDTLRAALHDKHRDLLTWALPVLYVAHELSIIVVAARPDDSHDLGKTEVSHADAKAITDTVTDQVLREAMQANRELADAIRQLLGPDLRRGTDDEPVEGEQA